MDLKETESKSAEIIKSVAKNILSGDIENAKRKITCDYPFVPAKRESRNYTVNQRMGVFVRDGFIDRYSGEKLVNPGILRLISEYFPEEFPYQQHWKTTQTHNAYWELYPTIDHVDPIAYGGKDEPENWVTTSMLNNSIKSNWTLEQLRWSLYPAGEMGEWDGLTQLFVEIIKKEEALLAKKYIRQWYDASLKYSVV